MPQFDPTTFSTQIFWLILTFLALYLVLSKVVLPRISNVLEQRQEKIEDDLNRAEKLKAEAEEVLADYRKSLDGARVTAQANLKSAADEMAAVAAERQASFNAELAAKTSEAEARIAKAQEEALANLKGVAVEAASAATVRLIGVELAASEVQAAVDRSLSGSAAGAQATGGAR